MDEKYVKQKINGDYDDRIITIFKQKIIYKHEFDKRER